MVHRVAYAVQAWGCIIDAGLGDLERGLVGRFSDLNTQLFAFRQSGGLGHAATAPNLTRVSAAAKNSDHH